jgi:hypothetical protein
MEKKLQKKSSMSKVAPKSVLDKNAGAFENYDTYKKAADIIEQTDIAAGKRVVFKSETGSTLNFEINRYGISSTTAQDL